MLHPAREPDPATQVELSIDGQLVTADRRETVAAVLLRVPPHTARTSISGRPRAPYCLAGACFDCVAVVDGRPQQTCLIEVRDGMQVWRQPASFEPAPPGSDPPRDAASPTSGAPS